MGMYIVRYLKFITSSYFPYFPNIITYCHGASYQPVSFQKLLKILQNGALVTIALFWLTLYLPRDEVPESANRCTLL